MANYKKGEKVKYVGKGFLGFDPKNKTMTFIEMDCERSAYIQYKGVDVLVSLYEIETIGVEIN